MIEVIFICLGNICRSPMAEFIFREMVKKRGLEDKFYITSRATSSCEAGSPVYPPARRELAAHGIIAEHTAAQVTLKELESCDFALVMDSSNLADLNWAFGGRCKDKIFKLCSFTSRPRDVADPWYTRDFKRAYDDIEDGCQAFLDYVISNKLL